ncbi:copper resistance CopC/CopD family protein [Mesobacillus thioparans]|uniref:copper resistance CopC/CopD family protein n=1 Tax=Mesobacillus thioparans TaxID=370439 RepID=UPI0039EE0477
MSKRISISNLFILCSLLFIFMVPQEVFAHATLKKAEPAPDSELTDSPNEIVLLFDERLENELYSIKVFNEKGERVVNRKPEMSKDQKSIKQSLPDLPDGNYVISYSVISADGHPIKSSYVVSIGEETVFKRNINQQVKESQQSSAAVNVMKSSVRILFYMALILTTGWIIWGAIHTVEKEMKPSFRQRAFRLQIALLITTVGLVIVQLSELVDHWTLTDIGSVLVGTNAGKSLVASVLLSLIGLPLLLRFKWLDLIWVLSVMAVKSFNGHAAAFETEIRSMSMQLDVVHLLAAAIWAGGLLYILTYWKKQREHVRQFLPFFSQVALISMLILIFTGVAYTLIFLPELNYLLHAQWGKLLLVKVGLVTLVFAIGAFLRHSMKKKQERSISRLVKIDFSLMVVILGIVGVLTHLNPLPENEPLEWKNQDQSIDFTTSISPKAPGYNHFKVTANAQKENLEIKRIELFLIYQDNPEIQPIQVPFSEVEPSNDVQFKINGSYLPIEGNWTAELRIVDSEDNEKVFHKDFIVY